MFGRPERHLRRECRTLLRSLDIEPPLDIPELCRRLGEQRERPIRLYPYDLEVPGPFGLWFGVAACDAIIYQRGTPRWHQDHIILHELGHLLAGHPNDAEVVDEITERIRANPPEGLDLSGGDGGVQRRRSCYTEPRERQAELIATTIGDWNSVLRDEPVYSAEAGTTGAAGIGRSLTHHQGWR